MASFFPRNKIKQDFCQGCRINSNENLIPGMMIVEETASAAPKGQANLVNSQAKEPQSDRTLERTPPMQDGVTEGEPVRQISQVDKTETGKKFFFFLSFSISNKRRGWCD